VTPSGWVRSRFDQVRRHVEQRIDQAAALAYRRMTRVPQVPEFDGEVRLAIVTVNYSTTHWLKLLLLTLSEQEDLDRVFDIVIVDNGSRDGGRSLLRKLAACVPRIVLVENDRFLSHARGMRLGIRALDRNASPANVILSVDADVIFLRRDAISALSRVFADGAVLAGEMRHGLYDVPEAQASFVAVRRDVYARHDFMPWVNHGAPSYWMQKSIRHAGLPVSDFPTYREGYALHRGRAGVKAASAFWPGSSYASVLNNEPHFMGVPGGAATWRAIERRWSLLTDPDASDAFVELLGARFR
jgi:glycosyltransferase involved in cell wall biosynthesis